MLSSSSKFILKLKGKKVIGSTSLSNTFRSSYNFKVAFSTFSKPGNSQSNHLSTLHVLSKHKVEDFDLRDFDTFPRRMKNSPLKESPLIQSGEALFGNRNDSWWTGKLPKSCTYIDGQAHSLPFLSLEKGKCDKFTLQAYFDNTWTLTESLFAGLQGTICLLLYINLLCTIMTMIVSYDRRGSIYGFT